MSEPSNHEKGPASSDLSGRQLGDFRLLRRLGRGAMADVYLAEQCSLNRQVAVKILKSDLATDATYVKRFQREAQAAASLVHANIVQIHEVGCIDDYYYIAQEYVQGLNLREWLNRNGTPDLRLALIVMRQTAAALAKAADHGIIHRDIKPENIMLTRSGEVKVADFGLARIPRVTDGVELTQVGVTMGTPLYMSPEQVEGETLDPRSDIYSFGVTCYHMLAGEPPFAGETALSVAVQHLKKTPEPLENARTDLPPSLCRFVAKMLAKVPDDRYQSARELLRDLYRLQAEHLDEEWPDDLPGLETAGVDVTGTTRQETTAQLHALMKTVSRETRKHARWVLWTAGALTAFFLGGAVALLALAEPALLTGTGNGTPPVPREESVDAQFLLASELRTEEGWQAVIDNFPENEHRRYRAMQQLATIHLQEDDEKAKAIFDEFVELGDTFPEFQAFGLAGQCYFLWKLRKEDDLGRFLTSHSDIRSDLKDPKMRQLLRHIILSHSARRQVSADWQKWIEEEGQLGEEPPAG